MYQFDGGQLRVLLINPLYSISIDEFVQESKSRKINALEPLGLAYISSYIKNTMLNVKIKLFDHHIESLRWVYENKTINEQNIRDILSEQIRMYKPHVVGISNQYHMTSAIGHYSAKLIKEIDSKIIIAMGGVYPSISYEKVLADTNVDFVIPGEGEYAFKQFLEYLLGKINLSDVKSIAYREDDFGKVVYRRDANFFVHDLNELGLPDRENLPIGKYSLYGRTLVERFYKKDAVVAAVQASRGCPFLCAFCGGHVITSRKHRVRDVKDVVNEIKILKEKHGVEVIAFMDENGSSNPAWWMAVYDEMIKEQVNVRWVHMGGFFIPLMTEEFIAKAIESGLLMFNISVETGSRRVMKMMKKSPKIIDKADEVVKHIRKHSASVYVTGNFITGLPFETSEEHEQTLHFARSLDLDWALFSIFQPLPGCELYKYCIEHGHMNQEDYMGENLVYGLSSPLKNTPIPPEMLKNSVYHANLDINFVNSRSLRTRNYEQAIRDFEYVVTIAPDHAVAYYCLAQAYRGLGRNEDAQIAEQHMQDILETNEQQKNYVNDFGLKY